MNKLFIIAAALALTACAPHYSDGSRVGVVTKLSNKGLIWKSWEGSLNEGGTRVGRDIKGGESVVPNAFDFSVSDPAVVDQLQLAVSSGARVELVYQQWFISPPTIENDRVIIAVRPTK